MKPRIIFLSDVTLRKPPGSSRYIGPYILASQLEELGYDCIVIDYFTNHTNFFEYLEKFLTPETIFVGISTTMLSQPMKPFVKDFNKLLRTEATELYFGGYLWFNAPDQLNAWLYNLRTLIDKVNKNCKTDTRPGHATNRGYASPATGPRVH